MNYYLFITFIFNKLAVNLNFIGSQSVVKTSEISRRIHFVLGIFKINHVVGLTACILLMRVWSIRYRCTAGTGVAARLLECPGGAGSINMYESDMSCFITDNVMIIQAGGRGGDSGNTSHVNTKHACKGLFSNYHKSCMIYGANSKVNTVCCFIVAMLIYRHV